MEGPPTRMMYSPDAGEAAFAPGAKIDNAQTSRRRFIMAGESIIYAGRKIAQVVAAIGDRGSRHQRCRLQHIDLPAHQILPRLPFSNQREWISPHQALRRQRTRIVIRSHHKSVGARAHDGEQIALPHFWHFAIKRKKISALANRSDNVDFFLFARLPRRSSPRRPKVGALTRARDRSRDRLFHRNNLVITVVKRWSNEIVHSRIHDREFFLTGVLDVADVREQNARVADE